MEGRVCSVTVTAAGLKEAWLCGPEGNRRPEPPPGVHLQAVGVKTVMYWSLNKISVYGDRVHGEAVPVSSQLIYWDLAGADCGAMRSESSWTIRT